LKWGTKEGANLVLGFRHQQSSCIWQGKNDIDLVPSGNYLSHAARSMLVWHTALAQNQFLLGKSINKPKAKSNNNFWQYMKHL